MAKLSQLKQNKVRCLFVCKDNGEIEKITNQAEFENVLSMYENDSIVKMFNPTEHQKAEILNFLEANIHEEDVSVDGKTILEIIGILTDVEIDVEGEEAEKILNEPNDLLSTISLEVNSILFNLVSLHFENIKNMAKLPPELLKSIVENSGQVEQVKKTTKKKSTKSKK